jgi:ParB-like chromosome segregation protein Spo0J
VLNYVSINLLKPHPKNQEYYSDLTGEKYEEIKRSIEIHGIRDPIKVLPDFTIIAGHQRYRIALELEHDKAPVEIMDINEQEAEYLLIADNEERRQSDDDPIKKAKRAEFLKKYWGVKQGKKRQNVVNNNDKNMADVAAAIGEDERTTQRLLKLNNLIPELQSLVSAGKLGTTAAHIIAFLSPENQKLVLEQYGQKIEEMTVQEAKNLRAEIETELKEKLQSQIDDKEKSLQESNRQLKEATKKLTDLERSSKRGHEALNKLLDELGEKQQIIEQLNYSAQKDGLVDEIAKLEKERNLLMLDLEDLKHQADEVKQRRHPSDIVIQMTNKTLNPLLEFKSRLELALAEVNEDPYESINMCFTRHIRSLENITELMKRNLEQFKVQKKSEAI